SPQYPGMRPERACACPDFSRPDKSTWMSSYVDGFVFQRRAEIRYAAKLYRRDQMVRKKCLKGVDCPAVLDDLAAGHFIDVDPRESQFLASGPDAKELSLVGAFHHKFRYHKVSVAELPR